METLCRGRPCIASYHCQADSAGSCHPAVTIAASFSKRQTAVVYKTYAVQFAEQDQCSKANANVKVVGDIKIGPADVSACLRGFNTEQRKVWQHLAVLQLTLTFLSSPHALATMQFHLSPASSTCAMSGGRKQPSRDIRVARFSNYLMSLSTADAFDAFTSHVSMSSDARLRALPHDL